MLDGRWRAKAERALDPIGRSLHRLGISANGLTVLGLVIAAATAVAIGSGHLTLAFFGVVLTGVPDVLDGSVARYSGKAGPRGAFFDSVADRVSDALLFGGVAWYLADQGKYLPVLVLAVLALSMIITYERARAESLGFSARGGLMERAERMVLLAVGLLFDILVPMMWIMLALTALTAVHRFVKVWRQATRAATAPSPPGRPGAAASTVGDARAPPMNADVRGRAAYLAYRAGADLARVTPPAIGSVVAGGLSRVMTVAWPARRAQVVRNLQRVSGGTLGDAELDRMVNDVFSNYARYWHEFFRLQDASREWILEHCVIEGIEHIHAALDAGRGGILALPHLGNWDMAGACCAALGVPMSAVAEPVEPPELFEWFAASRRRIGLEVIPLGPGAGANVSRALAANRIVCLLCDRDLVGNGVTVDFFGETTTVPSGPATLALRTGARLLPCAAFQAADGQHVGRVAPALPTEREGRLRADVQRVTEALVREMEAFIRVAPEQWLLMQPNWPSDHAANGASA